MTRKDYRLIATCIREERENIRLDPNTSEQTLYSLTARLMSDLTKDNPRFDRSRFELGCGYLTVWKKS
jgi:hypothetical protein